MIYFFDAWDDNVLDLTKWASAPFDPFLEQNGHLECDNSGNLNAALAIKSGAMYTANLVGREVLYKGAVTAAIGGGMADMAISDGASPGTNNLKLALVWTFGVPGVEFRWGVNGADSNVFDVAPPAYVGDQFYQFKIKIISTSLIEFYIDNILVKTWNDPANPITIEPACFFFVSLAYGKYNDFIFQDSVVPSGGTKLNCPISMLI